MSNNHSTGGSGPLTEKDWKTIIERIELGECTPFLGAGINSGLLPLGRDIAKEWAAEYGFPLADTGDLPRVAQFLSLTGPERIYPKYLIQTRFRTEIERLFCSETPPNFIAPHHPLGILAALPLRIYVTTNYDDFAFRALKANGKNPSVELCAWTSFLEERAAVIYSEPADGSDQWSIDDIEFQRSRLTSNPQLKPTAKSPLVYHMHGHYQQVDSLVLTENDYLDFVVNMSRDQGLLPDRIKLALTGNSLLFMGYSLADPNFRVIFRGLIHPFAENRRLSVSIQLRPSDVAQPNEQRALEFLEKYFEDLKIKVFWGTAEEFSLELWRRWQDHKLGGKL